MPFSKETSSAVRADFATVFPSDRRLLDCVPVTLRLRSWSALQYSMAADLQNIESVGAFMSRSRDSQDYFDILRKR